MASSPAPSVEPPPGPRRRLLVRRVLLAAVLLGALAVAAGNVLVLRATAADIAPGVAAAPVRSTAIVLGNTVFPGGVLSRSLAERVKVSLDLFRAGKVSRIIVSGAYHPETGYDEPGAMAAWLETRGVPHDALVLDRLGHRTAATMANAAAMGVRDALVCTEGYHLPRSIYLARHAGIAATGVPAVDTGRPRLVDLVRPRLREWLARTETVVEVAVRGVTAR